MSKKPWLEPNSYGEKPGGVCCQRATGRYCYEHDPQNYAGPWTWRIWGLLVVALFLLVFLGVPIWAHWWTIVRTYWGF